jgi:hypothetical protein
MSTASQIFMAVDVLEVPCDPYGDYPSDFAALIGEKEVLETIRMVTDHPECRGFFDADLEEAMVVRKRYSQESFTLLVQLLDTPCPSETIEVCRKELGLAPEDVDLGELVDGEILDEDMEMYEDRGTDDEMELDSDSEQGDYDGYQESYRSRYEFGIVEDEFEIRYIRSYRVGLEDEDVALMTPPEVDTPPESPIILRTRTPEH